MVKQCLTAGAINNKPGGSRSLEGGLVSIALGGCSRRRLVSETRQNLSGSVRVVGKNGADSAFTLLLNAEPQRVLPVQIEDNRNDYNGRGLFLMINTPQRFKLRPACCTCFPPDPGGASLSSGQKGKEARTPRKQAAKLREECSTEQIQSVRARPFVAMPTLWLWGDLVATITDSVEGLLAAANNERRDIKNATQSQSHSWRRDDTRGKICHKCSLLVIV
eukprot:g9861.t1